MTYIARLEACTVALRTPIGQPNQRDHEGDTSDEHTYWFELTCQFVNTMATYVEATSMTMENVQYRGFGFELVSSFRFSSSFFSSGSAALASPASTSLMHTRARAHTYTHQSAARRRRLDSYRTWQAGFPVQPSVPSVDTPCDKASLQGPPTNEHTHTDTHLFKREQTGDAAV
jgi:hypothetical protein